MENKKFWKYIKDLREEKKVIQQTCADALNIQRLKYIQWEKGYLGKPTDEFLATLAGLLGTSLENLLEKWDDFLQDEEVQDSSLDHLSPMIRNIITNPEYKDVVENGIMEYMAKMTMRALEKK